ncbi:MAG: sarcosine oxidase subunit gamma [Methyloceanibacter sp.]|uniref:sarcosine oxidase subunit gamma n=1 Tax=Methyloceanibacter sp. TaxID=1965321 RepID=UPI003D6D3933
MSSPLPAMSALHGLALPGRYGRTDGEPGVVIGERVGLGVATVACRKGQDDGLKASVREAYGVELPLTSTVTRGKDVSFIGTGPGQWLAVSETLGNETLAEDLAAKLAGLASISDQSGGRAVIGLSGPRARDVLAKGLAIDLDPRAFPPGSAATSTISHMGVQIWQLDDTQSYDIAIFRSVAPSFWRWLTSSAAEFGYQVASRNST